MRKQRSEKEDTGMRSDVQPTETMNVASASTDAGVWISQREHVRRLRVQRHVAVAALAGSVCAFIYPMAATLPKYMLISILVFVMLNSFGRAMDARLGYLWGWLYPEPERTTRFDRVVDRIINRLTAAGQMDHPSGRVRPL